MHTLYTQYLSIVLTRLLLSYILEYTHYILSISVTLYTQCLSIRDSLPKFSDCSCDWQMGKKKGRVQKHATRAKSARGSDAEESESGDLSGTSSEKQRLFDTRAALREAQPESLRLAGEIADDDEADEHDADDDDDDTHAKEMSKKKSKKSRAGSKVHLHCKLPDGTFRVVRAWETDAAANVGMVATALTSSVFRHALRIYNAAVDDLETSAADIAFLRSVYETERQADFDRANPAAYAASTFAGAAYIDFSDRD